MQTSNPTLGVKLDRISEILEGSSAKERRELLSMLAIRDNLFVTSKFAPIGQSAPANRGNSTNSKAKGGPSGGTPPAPWNRDPAVITANTVLLGIIDEIKKTKKTGNQPSAGLLARREEALRVLRDAKVSAGFRPADTVKSRP
jgi:hypothetical protein